MWHQYSERTPTVSQHHGHSFHNRHTVAPQTKKGKYSLFDANQLFPQILALKFCLGHSLCWAWLRWYLVHGTAAGPPDSPGDDASGFSPSAGRRRCCFFLVCPLTEKETKHISLLWTVFHSYITQLYLRSSHLPFIGYLSHFYWTVCSVHVSKVHSSIYTDCALGCTKPPSCKQMLQST